MEAIVLQLAVLALIIVGLYLMYRADKRSTLAREREEKQTTKNDSQS